MNKYRSSPLLGGLLACTLGASLPAHAERTLKASLVLSKDHALGQGLTAFAACVAQKSGGALKIQPFFDGALGNDAAVMQQLRSGTVDIQITATSYAATIAPEAAVYDLPFLFANTAEADAALDGKSGALLAQKLTGTGLVTLGYWENGFRNVTNSKRPIQRMEDLQGVKLRVLPTPVMLATFKALGAFAVPMPFTELYSALETKTVDGQENPVNLIESTKMYEVQKYLSLTRHVYNPVAVLHSKQNFDRLSGAEQTVLRECGAATQTEQRRISRQQSVESLTRLKALGMTVNDVSEAEIARMRTATRPVHEEQSAKIGTDMMNAVTEDIRRARKP